MRKKKRHNQSPVFYERNGNAISHLERKVNHEEYGDYRSPDATEDYFTTPARTVDGDSETARLVG